MNPSRFGLVFHHLGLAARNESVARSFLTGLGYSVGQSIHDPEQNVRLSLCHGISLPTIELILKSDKPGPLDKILGRQDSCFYHTGYLIADEAATLGAFAADGVRLAPVGLRRPAILFGGIDVSFHYVENFGLIEFIHAASV